MRINEVVEVFGILFFFIGLFGILTREHILKTILSLGILEMGIILYVLGIHYDINKNPPLIPLSNPTDPLPQAMMITTIVIGISVTAVCVTLLLLINKKYGTSSWQELKKWRIE